MKYTMKFFKERELAHNARSILEQEIATLRQKLSVKSEEWLSSTKEIDSKEASISEMQSKLKAFKLEMSNREVKFGFYLNEVANLLSDDFTKVDSNEEIIKEKIKLLMTTSKERGAVNNILYLFLNSFELLLSRIHLKSL